MPSLPRIITVDPTGFVARIVRATIDLSEYACRQIDVPSGTEALEELEIGGGDVVVSALDLEDMSSIILAEEVLDKRPNMSIVLLANTTDPEMTLNEQIERGFVYLKRPVNIEQFSRVLFAGMRGNKLFEALRGSGSGQDSSNAPNYGPVPTMHSERAGSITDRLLIDLGAMCIMLMGRDGQILLERGADNYLDHDSLVNALMPSVHSTIDMRDLVGGDATVLQFYDGDRRDVYTLSVGLHHLLVIAYDGEKGQREFGMVNRLGRKAAMDLIALLGAEAFMLRRSKPEASQEEELPRRTATVARVRVEDENEEPVHLERATEFASEAPEIERLQMEAISDDDFDPSFLDQLGDLDDAMADDLFSLESLEGVEVNVKTGKTISRDDAEELGLL